MNVLILGANGMLGHGMFHTFAQDPRFHVTGTIRSSTDQRFFPNTANSTILAGIDVEHPDSLARLIAQSRPDIIINCIGLVKQLAQANDPLLAVPINTMLPHRLALLADTARARLIHISTDCVFAGTKGMYIEDDFADADDLYGRSKYLGELHDASHAITLRTSIIGHELHGHRSLVNWFLAQEGTTRGYRRAIFSGLPTIELARVVRDYVIPQPELCGLYHVAAAPINKFDLLHEIARVYHKDIIINPFDDVAIDRSLDASRFNAATGYAPPAWPDLIQSMHQYYLQYFQSHALLAPSAP